MDRIKRNERMAALTKWLTEAPNKIFTLSHFCDQLGTAKSTLSEDIDILRKTFAQFGLGKLETVTGAAGGVRYRPWVSPEETQRFLSELSAELCTPTRLLPGGFLYLGDILSLHDLVSKMGVIIAQQYYDAAPDFVLTMETKGIPVALMTSHALGVPLVIARHSSKVYEGSAVNINYVSGTDKHIDTMSLSRRAVQPGQKALIVDDFLKAGGTAKGMTDLMAEFDVEVVGTAFVVATETPVKRCISGEKALLTMNVDPDDPATLAVRPSDWVMELAK